MILRPKITQIIMTVVYLINAHSCIQSMVLVGTANPPVYTRVVTPTIGMISPLVINSLARGYIEKNNYHPEFQGYKNNQTIVLQPIQQALQPTQPASRNEEVSKLLAALDQIYAEIRSYLIDAQKNGDTQSSQIQQPQSCQYRQVQQQKFDRAKFIAQNRYGNTIIIPYQK